MIDVSIVIATYNAANTIRAALDSVQNQNFNSWECIIIDGTSKDNTMEIVQEYSDVDKRFRHISEPDKGIYDAFNKGWKLAKGTWVYYLGADDILLPNAFSSIMFCDNIDQYSVVYGNVISVYPNGYEYKVYSKNYPMIRYRFFGSHQGILMKRDVIKELGGFKLEYKVKADFALVQKAFIKQHKFLKTDVFIAKFFLGGVSNQNIPWFDNERYRILKDNKSTKFPFVVVAFLGCFLKLRRAYYKIKTK